jgi:hypothetical protein
MELEEEIGVPAGTYLFDAWFAHDSDLIEHVESHAKDWIGPLWGNRQVTYANKDIKKHMRRTSPSLQVGRVVVRRERTRVTLGQCKDL